MSEPSPFMTVPEVAARWRLSNRVVREMIASHRVPARKIGGQWLVLPADLETFEDAQLNVQPIRPRRRR